MDEQNFTILIEELRDGNVNAFEQLYDSYYKRVFSFAKSYLYNKENAEEIVQDVFLKIWEKRSDLTTKKSFDAFLFTISKNAILNTIRKSKHEKAFLEYKKMNPGNNIFLEEELNFKELEEIYQSAISQLSQRKQQVYLLSRKKFLTHSEISKQLGISIKTVENLMGSAIMEIKRYVSTRGFAGMLIILFFVN